MQTGECLEKELLKFGKKMLWHFVYMSATPHFITQWQPWEQQWREGVEESKNLVFRKLYYCILTCLAIPWGTSTEGCLCFGPLEQEQFPGWCLSKCLNLLVISHKFSKATGYKINTQKSIVFLCTSNEQWKQKIRRQFHLQ